MYGNELHAHVISDMAVSRTFQILYRNEDVMISDVISIYRSYNIDLNVCLSIAGDENELPAHVISDMAVSRTFQILYRNEDVMISDVMSIYRSYNIDSYVSLSVVGDENELPAHVISDMAVSRTFQILYRNEDVMINDVILYRFHTLIDSTRVSLVF